MKEYVVVSSDRSSYSDDELLYKRTAMSKEWKHEKMKLEDIDCESTCDHHRDNFLN